MGTVQAVFHHTGRDVGMMVLDAEDWKVLAFCAFHCIARGEVVRMQITGEGLGFNPKESFEMLDAGFERFQCS